VLARYFQSATKSSSAQYAKGEPMTKNSHTDLFTPEVLSRIFPPERADQFFEAIFGDSSEGAYDVNLVFKGYFSDQNKLQFELQLNERPGKCLTCSLTYGLPEVFSVHPVINVKGLVKEIERLLGGRIKCVDWSLDATRTVSNHLHIIPLTLNLDG
jgi:hypothetical protein